MNTETINTQLYEKMFAEQERYRDWLLHQPPEEILNHAYEYAIREDILMALESRDLSFMQAQMLIFTATPLADILKEFDNLETDHMDVIRNCCETRADAMLKLAQECPAYCCDASYAKSHGEIEQYRNSFWVNMECKSKNSKQLDKKSKTEEFLHSFSVFVTIGLCDPRFLSVWNRAIFFERRYVL